MTATPVNALDRIHGSSELTSLLVDAAAAFDVGHVISSTAIEVGYEDCNVDVTTDRGRYVFKVFASSRTPSEIDRYVDIMEHVSRADIAHPILHAQRDGTTLYVHPTTRNGLVVMDYVDGQTFMELDRAPSADELVAVVEQAARINALDIRPSYLFDSWAVPNIDRTIDQVSPFITTADRKLVEQARQAVHEAHAERLPHTFVHGDITKANVIVPAGGPPVILDFAAANVYPRIQELAVIAANLMHDGTTPLRERAERVATTYESFSPLTTDERHAVHGYTLGAAAMEFLGALKEMHLNANLGDENLYWLELGRSGLRSATEDLGLS
jgi:Ser/Thr protein kinase RdoA (MazF antagonist)